MKPKVRLFFAILSILIAGLLIYLKNSGLVFKEQVQNTTHQENFIKDAPIPTTPEAIQKDLKTLQHNQMLNKVVYCRTQTNPPTWCSEFINKK